MITSGDSEAAAELANFIVRLTHDQESRRPKSFSATTRNHQVSQESRALSIKSPKLNSKLCQRQKRRSPPRASRMSSCSFKTIDSLIVCLLLATTIVAIEAKRSDYERNNHHHQVAEQTDAAQSHRSVGIGSGAVDLSAASDEVTRNNGLAPMPEQRTSGNRQLRRAARSPAALALMSEMRISGSKSEPPSRPSVDWSKQRPYFGPDMQRNVSVELGKTAYLVCKVYELGDKTVSWLRPRENEILTAGRYTYIGDSRFSSINDNGSHDWILEIKDVGLNDSTSYECQVSTDPKMSTIINLHVKAAKARIKQGEQFYAPLGSNIEFTCEIMQRHLTAATQSSVGQQPQPPPQTYWYHNGNLLNYAKAHLSVDKNFSIDWEPMSQTSRFKLFNTLASDAGNYTCKPTSAEPATIRLHVKKSSQKSGQRDRSQQHVGHPKDPRNRQQQQQQQQHHHYGVGESLNGLELMDSSAALPSLRIDLRLLSLALVVWLTLLTL